MLLPVHVPFTLLGNVLPPRKGKGNKIVIILINKCYVAHVFLLDFWFLFAVVTPLTCLDVRGVTGVVTPANNHDFDRRTRPWSA